MVQRQAAASGRLLPVEKWGQTLIKRVVRTEDKIDCRIEATLDAAG